MEVEGEFILDLARRLRLAGHEIRKKRDANASIVGLTSSQADALYHVMSNPGCMIADLSKGLGTSHQAACGYVDRLSESGLIRVEQSRNDARARLLHPTDDGVEAYHRFIQLGVEVNKTLFSPLTDEEVLELSRIIDKLNM